MYQIQLEQFIEIEEVATMDMDDLKWALHYESLINSGIPTVEDRDVSYLLKPYKRTEPEDIPF